MNYILAIVVTLTLMGCGGSSTSSIVSDNNAEQQVKNTQPMIKRIVNIYIHGYNQEGEKQTDTYGKSESDKVLSNIAQSTGYATMENYEIEVEKDIIVMTDYYGSTPPDYYTTQDIIEVENAEKGIPRYALIVAKYIKNIQKVTGAQSINIISASMGTLVSRYLIEKDLENISSDKKIKKWLSFEGVVKGNVAGSKTNLVHLLDVIKPQPAEVAQMHYDWVKENLDENSSYYKNIQIAFESSTRDDLNKGAITGVLLLDGKNPANDGVQAVNDTFFENPHSHVLFHENHRSLTDNMAVWGFAATFLISKKHVRITLLDARVNDLHELFGGRSEIVFESSVHSLKAQEKWNFTNAIDERMLDSGYLKLYKYANTAEAKELNQVLFSSYVLDDENELILEITPYELDFDKRYKLVEISNKSHESLGTGRLDVPVKNGIYEINGADWSGRVKVEVE
ncbi:MAG: hypothetical protein L3J43_05555 [Sulfurovum sp.]|nr:hypothetical protein [Sulfurovum sp.]